MFFAIPKFKSPFFPFTPSKTLTPRVASQTHVNWGLKNSVFWRFQLFQPFGGLRTNNWVRLVHVDADPSNPHPDTHNCNGAECDPEQKERATRRDSFKRFFWFGLTEGLIPLGSCPWFFGSRMCCK